MRSIVAAKRTGKRTMDDLRVEVGVNESFKKKLVRSRRADYLEKKMGDE